MSLLYEIVEGTTTATIKKQVNELLADGWQLHGTVAVVPPPCVGFIQIMVKECSDDDEADAPAADVD